MNTYRRTLIRTALLLGVVASSSTQALTIQFDYRYDQGFFSAQERRDRLEQAAGFFAGVRDSLAPIAPSVDDHWSVWFHNPSNLGGGQVREDNLFVAADTLRVFVGGAAMGAGVLGYATTGTLEGVSGSAGFVDAVTSRGQSNTYGPGATDYGVWGGAIAFNSDASWHWGATEAGLDASRSDFLTTAVHELGHILGYGPADSWAAQQQGGLFLGAAAMAAYGGPVPVGGAHWAEGVTGHYAGQPQETLLDPSTPAGMRQYPTDLDYAGLQDIGWEVRAVPLPPALWLMGSGIMLMALTAARRKTTVDKH
ncbi:hypothetical protein TspCOW1_15340 [Thiohalobacter sp. COW1]|uniref:Glycosyltransferases n=1 Tax=Thiohalobacter thiocyanaticus TaxID=585455 RepID=A0A1Z4VPJ0_9GAMM|nr:MULTISPECIES: hypothetical protein [Thiohalobacter]BAZ93527.1 glycosyltransferases [Thiohalobacter thiocyanaticus]BCO31431.1 hypothetical protein TspCOW1_15340 [Thiohalobacter sp. COW1]